MLPFTAATMSRTLLASAAECISRFQRASRKSAHATDRQQIHIVRVHQQTGLSTCSGRTGGSSCGGQPRHPARSASFVGPESGQRVLPAEIHKKVAASMCSCLRPLSRHSRQFFIQDVARGEVGQNTVAKPREPATCMSCVYTRAARLANSLRPEMPSVQSKRP